jgi:hypothetical protein
MTRDWYLSHVAIFTFYLRLSPDNADFSCRFYSFNGGMVRNMKKSSYLCDVNVALARKINHKQKDEDEINKTYPHTLPAATGI